MNIHEYQAKALLREFGVPVPNGVAASGRRGRCSAAKELGGPVWVVKAQIHAGGRGKGKFKEASAGDKGGVRLAKSIDEVKQFAKRNARHDAGDASDRPEGKQVNRLYIEEGSDIDKELYLSALVDRDTSRVAFVVSTEGGMDIEDVAHDTPEKIMTFSIDPATGFDAASWPHVRVGARISRAIWPSRPRRWSPSSTRPSLDKDMSHARNQSAGRHQGRAS